MSKPVDLMAALKASLDQAKKARAERRQHGAGPAECQGADFSKVAAALAQGVEEHIRRDGLSPLKAALFRDRGGHAPGEACPSDPNPEPTHDQGCALLYDGDECTCGVWRHQVARDNETSPSEVDRG